jgi:release factor glutamine methyltransferase
MTQSSTPPPTSKAPDAQPATSERTWTVLELLQWTTDYLKRNGVEGARLDAEVLLAHALSMSRLDLYLNYENPVSAVDRTTFRELVQKRAQQRIPVSLLLGEREFWSMKLTVTSDV